MKETYFQYYRKELKKGIENILTDKHKYDGYSGIRIDRSKQTDVTSYELYLAEKMVFDSATSLYYRTKREYANIRSIERGFQISIEDACSEYISDLKTAKKEGGNVKFFTTALTKAINPVGYFNNVSSLFLASMDRVKLTKLRAIGGVFYFREKTRKTGRQMFQKVFGSYM